MFPAGPPSDRELKALARRDPALGRALRRVRPYPGVSAAARRVSNFQSLARAIVYQQLTGHAAGTIYGRLIVETGARTLTPEGVLALSEAGFRKAGLSAAKTKALRDLASRVASGELRLRGIARLPDDEIVERLTTVWGIGEWSAQMFLIFKLGRRDVMPSGDLGIREGLRRLDALAERPTPGAVLERSEPWRPLRTVASWVLWRLCDD